MTSAISKRQPDPRKFCLDTIEIKQCTELGFIELGGRLMKIRDEKLWRGGWESFGEYLADMQWSEATGSKLIRIFQKFVLEWQFSHLQLAEAGGWTVVAEVLPVVKTKQEAKQWLANCRKLSRTDLRRTIHEEKHNVDMVECKHADTYLLRICRGCGLRVSEVRVDN